MNVLQVLPYRIHPPRTGGMHRSVGLLSAFPSCGDTVYRFCQGGDPWDYVRFRPRKKIQLQKNDYILRQLHPLYDLSSIPPIFGLSYVFSGKTLKLWSPSWLQSLLTQVDIISVEEPWQVTAISDYAPNTPVVYSSQNVEAERYESDLNGLIGNWFYKKIEESEQKAANNAAAIVCTSERDKSIFNERYGADCPLFVAPNAISVDRLRKPIPSQRPNELYEKHQIGEDAFVGIFIGSSHPPNIAGAKDLVENFVKKSVHKDSLHLIIIGSVGDHLQDTHNNITITGYVDDIEPYFDLAHVGLNPVSSGSGSSIKMFEYFARGLPVISTEFGARGIEVTDGDDIIISNMDSFIFEMTRLRSNEKLRQDIGRQAYELVKNKYTWEQVSSDLREKYKRLVDHI